MTELLKGTVQFLTIAPEVGQSDIALVCFVWGLIDAAPMVQVERLLDGKIDKSHGRIEVSEVTDSGKQAPSNTTTGLVTFRPSTGGLIRRGWRVWEFLVRSAPGGQGSVTFRLSAGLPPSIPVRELAVSNSVALAPSLLNADTPIKVILGPGPKFPRLSEGINQANPDTAPDRYRGHAKGDGDPNQVLKDRSAKHVAALLHQAFFQLDAPHTLDPAWDEQAGADSWTVLSNSALEVSPIAVADERWARQVTEMLLLVSYSNPQSLYHAFKDYDLTATTFLQGNNPYFGLGYACQDLATFGVASRGIDLKGNALAAGAVTARIVHSATPAGRWYVNIGKPAPDDAANSGDPHNLMNERSPVNLKPLIEQVPDYGPGSVHLFSNAKISPPDPATEKLYDQLLASYDNGTPFAGSASKFGKVRAPGAKKDSEALLFLSVVPNKDKSPGAKPFSKNVSQILITDDHLYARDNQPVGAHVAFAVRVRHDIKKVQFIDTGALCVQGSTSNLVDKAPPFQLSIYDTVGTTQVASKDQNQPYKGTGIFPKIDSTGATALNDVVKKLTKARPLGLVRFALLDRAAMKSITAKNIQTIVQANGALIYASALMPMWGAEEEQNYYISRYLWSLRNMPNFANLEGVWMLYVPTRAYAKELANAGRGANVIDVAKSILPATDFARELAKVVSPLQDLVVDEKGKVKTLAHSGGDMGAKHLLHNLEGRTPTGSVPLSLELKFPPQSQTFDHHLFPSYFGT